jgi:hypothetical protein
MRWITIRGLLELTIDVHRRGGASLYNDAVLATALAL